MQSEDQAPKARPLLRLAGAVAAACVFALAVYGLASLPDRMTGVVSLSFLLILPAGICAFAAYVADLEGRRSIGAYLLIPLIILAATLVVAVIFLREGAVCVLMLSPLWVIGGLTGSTFTYWLRKRLKRGRTYCTAVLLLPLVAMQAEPYIPVAAQELAVTRQIVVEAAPDRIWPLLRGIPDVRPGEGRWTFTQDVVGVPRPLGARLVGEGPGAQRHAAWTNHIVFREEITQWTPGRRIGWRFIFDDLDGWAFTDRHLTPDSPYFRVVSGRYTLTPLGPKRTQVSLDTRYWMKTPVNGYAALWGEVFLGDLENNLLALIKQRAERPAA